MQTLPPDYSLEVMHDPGQVGGWYWVLWYKKNNFIDESTPSLYATRELAEQAGIAFANYYNNLS